MAVKKCFIENCNSSSTRLEDIGVTYHKFPKDLTLRGKWLSITHLNTNIDSFTYVCSRHFCKSDFQIYQDSKYVLKSDAVPSIFSWNTNNKSNIKMESLNSSADDTEELNTSTSSKGSEGENVEAIQRFIEDQEKEIQELEKQRNDKVEENIDKDAIDTKNIEKMEVIEPGEPMVIATSVIDMILSESEAKIANADMKHLPKHPLPCLKDKACASSSSNSMALSVGSKVEAKDFSEFWYAAKIIEVDYDEMEVLVHYENAYNKHDEWISVNSPRLRPINRTSRPITPQPSTSEMSDSKEEKQEEKIKLKYAVGERCLARWRDNRRFVATITKDLGNGHYEIIFDDGFQWKCNTSRLYKLKDKHELSVDTSMSPTSSLSSPVLAEAGPSGTIPTTNPTLPIFHTHLFDPTRDYLGSKSERREMKRKLNIKEIFNIGQKKQKRKDKSPDKVKILGEKKPKIFRRKLKPPVEVKTEVKAEVTTEGKAEIPDAVASIIGTVAKEVDSPKTPDIKIIEESDFKEKVENDTENVQVDVDNKEIINVVSGSVVESDLVEPSDLGIETSIFESEVEEEVKLEKFEKPDDSKQEVIEKMKEVITKLEDGLKEKVDSPKPELVIKLEQIKCNPVKEEVIPEPEKPKKMKIKKTKKLRLLQEKKVKKQVEKVKSELEEMKKQVEEMRKQMLMKTEELSMARPKEMPESFLLPGEWCCKWVDGQPVGSVTDIEVDTKDGTPVMPRRSVQVEDKRLPPDWTKLMVRRSLGQSAGKWDVVLIAPDGHRFHTKTDMRNFLEHANDDNLKPYESALLDFGVHLKLSRRMGWVVGGKAPGVVNHKRKEEKKEKKRRKKLKKISLNDTPGTSQALLHPMDTFSEIPIENPTLEDGYVYVGSLKVQIIENLLRCPAEGCFKNFRNNTLLQMHIKHYHRELRKMLGATPKVLDLARERTKPTDIEPKPRYEPESKIIKVKIPRPPKKVEEPKPDIKEIVPELQIDIPVVKPEPSRPQDSPKLRQALVNKPVKRPKVLLPVRRPIPDPIPETVEDTIDINDIAMETEIDLQIEPQDFETEISIPTGSKPLNIKQKVDKKRKYAATVSKKALSEEDDWLGMNSDFETRSSFPGSGTPDSKVMDKTQQPQSSESNEDQKESNTYMYTETGERIKIEHMKREEIINCHCGYREEDGLMVQCELCLCWQHALCHNIQREADVPEKYTCSICLNPWRGRRSARFTHDQDRLYEGALPGAPPSAPLRRAHELSGNLLRIQDALHALRVKYHVATKKDHPKLYLWAKDWENAEATYTQERLNSDYSDLNIIINNIGKENLPVKPDEIKDALDVRNSITEDSDQERYSQRDAASFLGLNTGLSSPSCTSLDLPITTSELERLAKSVQEQEPCRPPPAPQPEAAIEDGACRERLLRHVQRCQALLDARLDSIEAQIAELESQDPSFEDDETADFFPRTKQTIQMLTRDLHTMEELGVIT
ncbi:unnamed protein product, partial [Brenthis ino]